MFALHITDIYAAFSHRDAYYREEHSYLAQRRNRGLKKALDHTYCFNIVTGFKLWKDPELH